MSLISIQGRTQEGVPGGPPTPFLPIEIIFFQCTFSFGNENFIKKPLKSDYNPLGNFFSGTALSAYNRIKFILSCWITV